MSSVATEAAPAAVVQQEALTPEEMHALRWALRQPGYSIAGHAAKILARHLCRTRPELDGLEQAMLEGPDYPWTRRDAVAFP